MLNRAKNKEHTDMTGSAYMSKRQMGEYLQDLRASHISRPCVGTINAMGTQYARPGDDKTSVISRSHSRLPTLQPITHHNSRGAPQTQPTENMRYRSYVDPRRRHQEWQEAHEMRLALQEADARQELQIYNAALQDAKELVQDDQTGSARRISQHSGQSVSKAIDASRRHQQHLSRGVGFPNHTERIYEDQPVEFQSHERLVRQDTRVQDAKPTYSRDDMTPRDLGQRLKPGYLSNSKVPYDYELESGEHSTRHNAQDDTRYLAGVEVRSDDIRAATSMKYRRSQGPNGPPAYRSSRHKQMSVDGSNFQQAHGKTHDSSCASRPDVPTINISAAPTISIEDPAEICPSIAQTSEQALRQAKDTAHTTRHIGQIGKGIKPERQYIPAMTRNVGLCSQCGLTIDGRMVGAAGARFHPECFACYHCKETLECVGFFPEPMERRTMRLASIRQRLDGQEVDFPNGSQVDEDTDDSLRFYCHLDYHELFSPRCKSCKTPIEGEVIVACGAEWHVGHFFCAQCGDPFDPSIPFVEKDGYAWCVRCHTNRFSTKCKKCKGPVTEMVIKALGSNWHNECFCCTECNGTFEDGRYFLRDDCQDPVCGACEEKRLRGQDWDTEE